MLNSGPSLQMKYVFGLKPDNPQVFHVDEHKVVYPAGHNVITYNIEDKLMQYYPSLETTVEISHLSISPTRRYLAVCEKAPKAMCSIYDTQTQRRKKFFNNADSNAEEFLASAFVPFNEHKYLVTVSGAPDYELVYWQWERPRILATIKLGINKPVTSIGFNSTDPTKGFTIAGKNIFRQYRYQENDFKELVPALVSTLNSQNYTASAWTADSNLLIGTDSGQIAVMSNIGRSLEQKIILETGFEDFVAYCFMPFAKGFLVGGTCGRIIGYQLEEDNEETFYNPTPVVWEIPHSSNASVKCLSLSVQTEEYLVTAMDNSQIYISNFNPNKLSEEMNFGPLSFGFHHGPVTGLDVCVRKPIIVTCGMDRTVRIWNYQTKKLEVSQAFNEDPYCVAIHPSGFHIIVGFADKIRLLNVFNSAIKQYKELPIKACKEIKFSHGGHLFAVANGLLIQVFNFYSADCPQNMIFKGHSGKIKSIIWAKNDTGFVSSGIDGSVFEWRLNNKSTEQQQIQDYQKKGTTFNDLIYINSEENAYGTIYTVGTDSMINEITDSGVTNQYSTGITLGQVLLSFSGKVLYTGVSEPNRPGAIRAYKWDPFTEDYTEYQAHANQVERLRVSYDDSHLFSVGQDGCVCIFEVKDRELKRRERELVGITLSEELIITRTDILELNGQIEQLSAQMQELNNYNKLQLDRSVQEKKDLIEKLKEQIDSDSQQSNHRYDILAEEKKELELKSEADLAKKIEELSNEKQDKETAYNTQILKETGKYKELEKEKADMQQHFELTISNLDQDNMNQLREQDERHKIEMEEEDAEKEHTQHGIDKQLRMFDEVNRQINGDNSRAYNELKDKGNKEIYEVRSECSKYKGQLSIETKKYKVIQDDIDRMSDEKKEHKEAIVRNREKIKDLQQEKEKMKKEIAERDKTIGVKETRIFDLKRKNQELEKFKYVLDYKIKELRRDIVPREDEISKMKEQTMLMDQQLKAFNGVNESFGIQVEDLRARQEEMQAGIGRQRAKLRESSNRIQTFKVEMEEAVQHIQDYSLLKEHIIDIYHKYVKDSIKPKIIDSEMNEEYNLQRQYLTNNTIQLTKKLNHEHKARKMDSQRIMKDNQTLITEIYDLREKVKGLSNVRRHAEIMILKSPKAQMSLLSSPRMNMTLPSNLDEDSFRQEMETQRDEIKMLREQLAELETADEDETTRTYTQGEKLPPIQTSGTPQSET